MNTLFLIGNGFDLSLGLPTDYKSFYKYYLTTNSSSAVIEALKRYISSDFNIWSDLELAIGILDIFKDEKDYLECIRDLRNNMNAVKKSSEAYV